jgi:hypothetical protein
MELQSCTAARSATAGPRVRRRTGRLLLELAIVVAAAVMIVYAELWTIRQSPLLPGADVYAVRYDAPTTAKQGEGNTVLCSLPVAVLH